MLKPVGNKILVKPLYQDATARKLVAAMRSENNEDYVKALAEEIAPTGTIALVQTVPPVAGTVVAVGRPFCEECRRPVSFDVQVADVVVYHKASGFEIGIDSEPHVMLKPHDVLLIWRPDSLKETA